MVRGFTLVMCGILLALWGFGVAKAVFQHEQVEMVAQQASGSLRIIKPMSGGSPNANVCGYRALLVAGGALGREVDGSMLWDSMFITDRGVSLAEIDRCAREYLGLYTLAVRLGPEQLLRQTGPIILWIDSSHSAYYTQNHFLVYMGKIDSQGLAVMVDPTAGIVTLPQKDLSKLWNGPCLVVRSGPISVADLR